jgi:hypothetical protein
MMFSCLHPPPASEPESRPTLPENRGEDPMNREESYKPKNRMNHSSTCAGASSFT